MQFKTIQHLIKMQFKSRKNCLSKYKNASCDHNHGTFDWDQSRNVLLKINVTSRISSHLINLARSSRIEWPFFVKHSIWAYDIAFDSAVWYDLCSVSFSVDAIKMRNKFHFTKCFSQSNNLHKFTSKRLFHKIQVNSWMWTSSLVIIWRWQTRQTQLTWTFVDCTRRSHGRKMIYRFSFLFLTTFKIPIQHIIISDKIILIILISRRI